MADVIQIPTEILVVRSAWTEVLKTRLDEAEGMIVIGEGLHTVAAFLRAQMVDGPTLAIRTRAEALLGQLEARDDTNNPEPAA